MTTLASYEDEWDIGHTTQVLKTLALEHCRLAGKDADTLKFFIENEMWPNVCSYNVLYDVGYSVSTVLHMRQALGFFQKLEPLDIGVDKESTARNTFYMSEQRCLETNHLFYLRSEGLFEFPPDVMRVLTSAKRKIRSILGPVPELETLHFLFGPGATTSVPKRKACAREKLSAVPSCSTDMLTLAPYLLGELPHYAALHSNIGEDGVARVPVEVHLGRLAFVPKNAKTYRTTITEPTLNALMQSSLGRVITRRLSRVGQSLSVSSDDPDVWVSEMDTKDQTKNQTLAWEGSLSSALATLDLSSASDLLSYKLVEFLLPYEWFAALALCRTSVISDSGNEVHLHKFSSMGNGYTFPLQTLIFWSLAKACVREVEKLGGVADKRVSVFGDDIILGTEAVPLMSKTLDCVGFKLNMDKSYWEGPFRESCGKDYYFGFDVRPFYAKSLLTGEKLFLLHNFYYRRREYNLAKRVLDLIDPALRIYGPDGYGDGHLLSQEWVRREHMRDRGYSGYLFDTYTRKARYHFQVLPGDAVLPAYTSYERSFAREGDDANPTLHRKYKEIPEGEDATAWYPVVPIPGDCGVKRISIYTLMP